jgi:hypothetical protein
LKGARKNLRLSPCAVPRTSTPTSGAHAI